jgi:solute carrier family 13 (sodium-dependent dicarboxylate transporter), member 2/3/5
MNNSTINLLIGAALYVGVLFAFDFNEIGKGLGIVALMVYYWISQPLPLYVTALFPLILAPLSGLLKINELADAYGNHMIFLFLGGFIMAVAIEKWKLHEWISIRLIHFFGASPKRILLGFMVATWFLSMWISNTATALMMLPMALSVVNALSGKGKMRYGAGLMLGIAYAANIGGTATLIGTPPNVQLAGMLAQEFNITITFFDWLKIGLPFASLLLVVGFLLIIRFFCRSVELELPEFERKPLSRVQKSTLIGFSSIVFMWVFGDLLAHITGIPFNDTSTALIGGILFFIIPAEEGKPLLQWKDMERIPWGILLLFGGGLALAKILTKTGVILELVNHLSDWGFTSYFVVLVFFVTLTVFATELMSNLALVSLLIPIAGAFAVDQGYSVFSINTGIALAASCAFMLPVATPPNAILYSSNLIPMKSMVRVGLILNLIVVALISGLVYLVG